MIVKIRSVLSIWPYGHMYFWGRWWMFWLYFPYVKRSTRDIYSWFFMNRPNLSIIDSRFSRIKTLSRSAWLITHKSTIYFCSWTNIKLSFEYKMLNICTSMTLLAEWCWWQNKGLSNIFGLFLTDTKYFDDQNGQICHHFSLSTSVTNIDVVNPIP